VTSFELYTLQQEFDDTRASLPLVEAARYDAVGRLAVLLGTIPAEAERLLGDMRAATVELEQIPAGLPSDLLRERPDVWAAAQRLEAARQRVGIARADRFPRFSLTASGGTQSSELLDLVDVGNQSFFLFGGALVAPIFNAGALKAAEQAAWNRYEQAGASYEKTVLTAFKETGTALHTYEKEQERFGFLQEAEASAEASATTQQDRYVRGVGDYVALLDARRNLNRARLNRTASERALANARLAVHRALGGTWVENTTALE
jgi:outer membrane protein TolC